MEQKNKSVSILEGACLALSGCMLFVWSFVGTNSPEFVFPLFFAAGMAYTLYRDDRVEQGLDLNEKIPRYTSALNITSIFILLLMFSILPLFRTPGQAIPILTTFWTDLAITATIYYVLLALLLPFLRRHFNARTCAVLWLLPALLIVFYHAPKHHRPLLVLDLPAQLIHPLLVIWLTGTIVVLLWQILSHLWFRRSILSDAQPLNDAEALALWQQICRHAHMDKAIPVLRSPQVGTPLSIGLFSQTTCVVLPETAYTPQELELIFHHELVHIMRNDSQSKFFLAFLKALCWFNPLMWFATRKSADDLELSCDETVLLNASEEQRQRYASLLLHTAGDQRGFTTCLSASAKALRYRMRVVVAPTHRFVGGLMAGAMTLLLLTMSGYTAFSYGRGSGEALLLPKGRDNYMVEYVHDLRFSKRYKAPDSQAILDYLSELPLQGVTGRYDFTPRARSYEDGSEHLSFHITDGEQTIQLTLSDLGLEVYPQSLTSSYLLEDEIDWVYLESLLGPSDQGY